MRQDAYKPQNRPRCLDSFRIAAAELIEAERERDVSIERLAKRVGRRPRDLSVYLHRIRSGETDRIGFNLTARIIEAFGHEVRFQFVPMREAVAA